ncbi:MAG: carbon-nitrogen hydrolase family protein [Pseudomonadota bacterium]
MKVALAQVSPVFLNRAKTLDKVLNCMTKASNADLIVFGEALVPGYPFWVERTDGARFASPVQEAWHAAYQHEAVQVERGDLDEVCAASVALNLAVYLGVIERPSDRGGHSLYASLVFIDQGRVKSVHRKLMPTYEERLVWSVGDGHGLVTHDLAGFTIGGLNCWENWMPLARSALYAQGENLHIAVWPGSQKNTSEITRFIARESRSYVVSVSGLMRPQDWQQAQQPEGSNLVAENTWANGGSCVANPDGTWHQEPIVDKEAVSLVELNLDSVRRARHNFDPSGHYSRPDVTQLAVNRERQSAVVFQDNAAQCKLQGE